MFRNNAKTRHRVYSFFARHLMGRDLYWEEQPIETEDLGAFTWFRGEGHAPGYANDEEFFAYHRAERLAAAAPLPIEEKRKMLAWMAGVRPNDCRLIPISKENADHCLIERFVIDGLNGEKLPAVRLIPDAWDGRRVCLALGENGKDVLDREEIRTMLADGICVVSGDLFLTGEFEGCERDTSFQYFTTFHDTTDALRVQDTLLLIRAAGAYGDELTLWAEGCAARAALCAAALSEGVSAAVLEQSALRLSGDSEYYSKFFLPGISVLGGLDGCLTLARCPVTFF